MADFDLTQTDAQVQSILNDGQNMQGAGAQTTLTTESVLLKDVNGNYHKILKSSFTEAIRDTLAGLLVNNDKGTTINQIAAIANSDFGSITPANLASVLGGNIYRGVLNNKDLNNITTVGCYSVQEAQNRPVEYWGQLNVVDLDNSAVAQYFTTNTTGSEGSSIFFRKKISSSWSSWLHLDNFGCSTPADLASLLGEAGVVFQKANTAGVFSNVVRASVNSNASITLLVTRNFYNLPAFAAIIQIGRNTGEYGMNVIVPSGGISFSFDNTNGNITIGHNNQGNGLGTIRITILQRSTGARFLGEVDN